MPSAPDHLQQRMLELFGDPISDQGPIKFLENAGYVEKRFCWLPKPGVKDIEDMTLDEYDCMMFLALEYDYGDLLV